MKCTSETKWKYLRETDQKFYRSDRNTTLKEYLEAIFPNETFEYNYRIHKENIPEGVEYRRYQLDAFCRNLKLVVEFDGVNHYMDTQVCLNDMKKDSWLNRLGYTVIRIPYWIQLSKQVVKEMFDIEIKDELCQLEYSFYCPEEDSVNLNLLPGNMCELGRKRFIKEFNNFSPDIRLQVTFDLLTCAYNAQEIYNEDIVDEIIPYSVYQYMEVPEIYGENSEELEQILFGEPFNMFKYAHGVRAFWSADAMDIHLAHHLAWVKFGDETISAETAQKFLKTFPEFTAWGANIVLNPEENISEHNEFINKLAIVGFDIDRLLSHEETEAINRFAKDNNLEFDFETYNDPPGTSIVVKNLFNE